jgi:hypothetical protein
MRAFDSGSKPSGTMFPGHPFFSRTPRVQKPNTAYPKNRCESVLFLEMLTKLIHFKKIIFQRRDFLWDHAVFGFCTLGARDKK